MTYYPKFINMSNSFLMKWVNRGLNPKAAPKQSIYITFFKTGSLLGHPNINNISFKTLGQVTCQIISGIPQII